VRRAGSLEDGGIDPLDNRNVMAIEILAAQGHDHLLATSPIQT
jgi:hypothetical protein